MQEEELMKERQISDDPSRDIFGRIAAIIENTSVAIIPQSLKTP